MCMSRTIWCNLCSTSLDDLNAIYNARSCRGCHLRSFAGEFSAALRTAIGVRLLCIVQSVSSVRFILGSD